MPSQQQKLPTKGITAADKDRYQTVVNQSGLSDNKLQALALRLQELKSMSSDPAAIDTNIRAVNQCLKRRTLAGAGERVMARLTVMNAFKSNAKDAAGVHSQSIRGSTLAAASTTALAGAPGNTLAGTPGKMAIAAALRAARYAGSGAAAEAGVRKTGSESAGAGGGGGGGAVGAGAASESQPTA